MPTPNQIEHSIDNDTLRRALLARMELAMKTGERLVEVHRDRIAEALLSAGLTLIPSEHLLDHQFCVSPGVFAAAKRIGHF